MNICKRCKKELKNKVSILRGYGRTCFKKVAVTTLYDVIEVKK